MTFFPAAVCLIVIVVVSGIVEVRVGEWPSLFVAIAMTVAFLAADRAALRRRKQRASAAYAEAVARKGENDKV